MCHSYGFLNGVIVHGRCGGIADYNGDVVFPVKMIVIVKELMAFIFIHLDYVISFLLTFYNDPLEDDDDDDDKQGPHPDSIIGGIL